LGVRRPPRYISSRIISCSGVGHHRVVPDTTETAAAAAAAVAAMKRSNKDV
jgi:hypothetical protein